MTRDPVFAFALLAYFLTVAATSFDWRYAASSLGVILVLATRSGRLHRRLDRTAGWFLPPMMLALGLMALDFARFPATRHIAHPSTGPDAMIVPLQRLLEGSNPYAAPLGDGALISPGPGWWLLNAPLTGSGLIPALGPVWLCLAALLIGHRRGGLSGAVFVAALFACQDFLAQNVAGHDLFAVSLAWCVVCVLLDDVESARIPLLPVAVLAGLVATARLPLLVIIPVLAIRVRRPRRFIGIASGVALTAHASFAVWALRGGVFYQPLHVFMRARGGAGLAFSGLSAIAACLAGFWMCRRAGAGAARRMFDAWLIQFALFAPIGVGELVFVGKFDRLAWEGRNYVAWPLPLLCGYLAWRMAERGDSLNIIPQRSGAIIAARRDEKQDLGE